jgi:hypothetical protein
LAFASLPLCIWPGDGFDKTRAANPRLVASYAKLPLSFEANGGQTDRRVKFLSRGRGYTLFLTDREAVLALQKPSHDTAVLRMKLAGSRAATSVSGLEELPGKSNYFIGRDAARWHTQIPSYAKVLYQQPYLGIDLIYYGNQEQLEYDFVVAPGADPRAIRLRMEGARKMGIDVNGDLVLRARGADEVRFHKPVVYQMQSAAGGRKLVEGHYVKKGAHEVGFALAAYDVTKSLIIDPILTYSTYLGGSGDDYGNGIAVDTAGNAYLIGHSSSPDFPLANPLQPALRGSYNVFVSKLDATGSTLVYSTYLGGSAFEFGDGIAVDTAGNAYVTGSTASSDFPTVNPLQPSLRGDADAFVAKLDPTGAALLYSTYLGGASSDWRRGDRCGQRR